MPRKVVRRRPKKKDDELTTKRQVKAIVGRAVGKVRNTAVYYSDDQTWTASDAQAYVDLSAALYASKNVTGNDMEWRQLIVNGEFVYADTSNSGRLIVFKWHPDTDDAVPGSGDIIRPDNSTTATPIGLPHWEKRHQYKILYDRYFYSDTTESYRIKFQVKLGAKKLGMSQFNTAASTGTNHIYVMYCSDSGAVSHPTFHVNIRALFSADLDT